MSFPLRCSMQLHKYLRAHACMMFLSTQLQKYASPMSSCFAMPIYYKMCTTAVKFSLLASAAECRNSKVEMHAWSKSHLCRPLHSPESYKEPKTCIGLLQDLLGTCVLEQLFLQESIADAATSSCRCQQSSCHHKRRDPGRPVFCPQPIHSGSGGLSAAHWRLQSPACPTSLSRTCSCHGGGLILC